MRSTGIDDVRRWRSEELLLRAAGFYYKDELTTTLGVGWGDTVSRVIAATNFGSVGRVHTVTLTGGVDGYLQTILSAKSPHRVPPLRANAQGIDICSESALNGCQATQESQRAHRPPGDCRRSHV